jgi:hypothetical protein
MTLAVTLFELAVTLSGFAFAAFLLWWIFDAYQSSLAMDAAREGLTDIGFNISSRISPEEVAAKLRDVLMRDRSPAHEDYFVVLGSLYILRRELGLRCRWFAEQLSALPQHVSAQLVSGRKPVHPEDVKRLLTRRMPRIFGRRLTQTIAYRLEENIQDLRADTARLLRRVAEPM